MNVKVTKPTKSLLEGCDYVPASQSDIRVRFAKILREQLKRPRPVEAQRKKA